jgi:hypothetical protein
MQLLTDKSVVTLGIELGIGQVAVDATGLAQGAVSTFFVRRMYHHTQQLLARRRGPGSTMR